MPASWPGSRPATATPMESWAANRWREGGSGQSQLQQVAAVEREDRQEVQRRPAEGREGRRAEGEAALGPRRPAEGAQGVQHRQPEEDPGQRAGDGEERRLAPAERLGPAGAGQAAETGQGDGRRGAQAAGGEGVAELVAEHATTATATQMARCDPEPSKPMRPTMSRNEASIRVGKPSRLNPSPWAADGATDGRVRVRSPLHCGRAAAEGRPRRPAEPVQSSLMH